MSARSSPVLTWRARRRTTRAGMELQVSQDMLGLVADRGKMSSTFMAEISSSISPDVWPQSVRIEDYPAAEPEMLQHNKEVHASMGYCRWTSAQGYCSDTLCVRINGGSLLSSEECQQALRDVMYRHQGDKFDVKEKSTTREVPPLKGGFLNPYPKVLQPDKGLQSKSVFCFSGKNIHWFRQTIPGAGNVLDELANYLCNSHNDGAALFAGHKVELEQLVLLFGLDGSSAYTFHRDDEDNTLKPGGAAAHINGFTSITLLSESTSSMLIAGGEEFGFDSPGDTCVFHPSLFHRSGCAYPGTVKLVGHWKATFKTDSSPPSKKFKVSEEETTPEAASNEGTSSEDVKPTAAELAASDSKYAESTPAQVGANDNASAEALTDAED